MRLRLFLICCFFLFSCLLLTTPLFAEPAERACDTFVQALEPLPHESLFQRSGPFNSTWFKTGAFGCEMVMVTSEQRLAGQPLPDLTAAPGTLLYRQGWRIQPTYIADGPGTGVIGMEKGQTLCLVYTEQFAWIDDAGHHQQSDEIRIRVECLAGDSASGGPRVLIPRPQ